MKVIVIGGGPAGMLAAIAAAEQGNNVIILEKMNSLGRKLIITGKGRCNVTNSLPIEDFIKNIPGNGRFLYSAFQNFTNEDIINLLAEEGLKCKEERGNRVFPVTDRSVDVLNALLSKLKKLNVKIYTNEKVENILVKEIINNSNKDDSNSNIKQIKNLIKVTGVKTGERIYEADKVILATGGKSYPGTGSSR